jgi:phosphoglucomutase
MITETQIISILSGSIIGDYPSVIDEGEDSKYAVELFKKIIDIDNDGLINSSLFNITRNSQNPSVVADYQLDLIDDAQDYLTSLINVAIPSNIRKLNAILDPDSIQGITEEVRRAIFEQRNRLSNLINSVANVPIIFSEFITD